MNDHDRRNRLIFWLNDAYAMETELLPILRDHAQDAQIVPEIRRRLAEHVTETEEHRERLSQAIQLLGGSPSTLKAAAASIAGAIIAPGTAFFSDELMKNGLSDYAAEQFEVAAYLGLVTAAEELGEDQVAGLCRENLEEDEAMANWLLRQIPLLVRETLEMEAPHP